MNLSPSTRSPLADLLRLVAAWLAAILVMQSFQGALALGAGPRHVHVEAAGAPTPRAHSHGGFERHYHAVTDSSVRTAEPADTGALDASALALTLAMALMACTWHRALCSTQRHILHPALTWFWRSVVAPPLLRPPRPS